MPNVDFKTIGIYDKNGRLLSMTKQSELVSTKQNSFQGWDCYAPTTYLYINWDGEVYDTACRQRKRLGNIFEDFDISTEPVKCYQKYCWCFGDLRTLKIKDTSVTPEQIYKNSKNEK